MVSNKATAISLLIHVTAFTDSSSFCSSFLQSSITPSPFLSHRLPSIIQHRNVLLKPPTSSSAHPPTPQISTFIKSIGVQVHQVKGANAFNLKAQTKSNEEQSKDDSSTTTTTAAAAEEEIIKSMFKSSNQIPLLLASSKCVPNQMSPTSLAYIGDVVYEMFIRCRYVWPTRRTSDLQNIVVAKVRAETQSIIFLKVQGSFNLTKEEQTIISRGRNAGSPKKKSRGPKRLYGSNNNTNNNHNNKNDGNGNQSSASAPASGLLVGNQGPAAYQDSTALEALIGYLYLSDGDRCNELLEFICDILDEMDT